MLKIIRIFSFHIEKSQTKDERQTIHIYLRIFPINNAYFEPFFHRYTVSYLRKHFTKRRHPTTSGLRIPLKL